MSFFAKLFGFDRDNARSERDEPITEERLRAFMEEYLGANDLDSEDYLMPSLVDEARRGHVEHFNDLGVSEFEIERIEGPRVTAKINRSDGVWSHRMVFEVIRENGKLYIRPNIRGEWLDPWQESEFLSENYEVVFMLLESEDAPITDETPTLVAEALDGRTHITADTVPIVLNHHHFWEDWDDWMQSAGLTAAARSDLRRVKGFVEAMNYPCVAYMLRPRHW